MPDPVPNLSTMTGDIFFRSGKIVIVVVADNADDKENIVVTVYEPDPAEWEPGFRRRKKS